MTRRGGHRHLGKESNTRCPAPQLRPGINVDGVDFNEKAPLVNGPARLKAGARPGEPSPHRYTRPQMFLNRPGASVA